MNFFGKCAVVLAVMLALPMTLTAQIKVTHGPWLTDMSVRAVTIMWKTDKPAMAWVEYDEKTGDTFYSESHPKVYDTQDGRRRTLDTLHCVRLEGLKPGTEYFYRIYSKETVSFRRVWQDGFRRTTASSAIITGLRISVHLVLMPRASGSHG